MKRAGLSISALLLLGSGCAVIIGIEDHVLAPPSSTTTSSAAGGAGGRGGSGTSTGGSVPNDCPPPDLGPTACPPGLADCDGDGSCEATLATDAKHCGACQHGCLGGDCQGSTCQEVAITPAYAPAEAFGPMTVHQGRVYYAAGPHEANIVYSVPVDGSATPDVVSTAPVGEVYHIVVYTSPQASFLFVTAHDSGKWIVHGMLASGGTPNDTADLESFSTGMAIDSEGIIYVAETSHILKLDFQTTEIVKTPDPIRGLAIDGQYVYWSSSPDAGSGLGKVSRAMLTGGAVTDLATGLGRPSEIALDEASVYWTDAELGTISRILKSGGQAETLVSGQSTPRYLSIAGEDLFWSASDGLYRTRLCALGEKPIRLTPNVVGAIAADGKHLFATDTVTHEVLSFAR